MLFRVKIYRLQFNVVQCDRQATSSASEAEAGKQLTHLTGSRKLCTNEAIACKTNSQTTQRSIFHLAERTPLLMQFAAETLLRTIRHTPVSKSTWYCMTSFRAVTADPSYLFILKGKYSRHAHTPCYFPR